MCKYKRSEEIRDELIHLLQTIMQIFIEAVLQKRYKLEKPTFYSRFF